MKICCLSDIHGHLPEIPECDLLLIGGDIVPTDCHFPLLSLKWFNTFFEPWLKNLSKRMSIVGVSGNHDFIFESDPHLVPKMSWTYLQDSGTEINGFKIWGSPWQPRFFNWAFNAEEYKLQKMWDQIPHDTDILLLHGPPHGYGDFSPYGKVNTGSPSLTKKIEEIKPKLVVAGHIHSGYGQYNIGDTIFINASFVDDKYLPAHEIIVVNIN